MKVSIIIYICAAVYINQLNSQSTDYFGRIQNVSVESELSAVHMTNLTIFRNYTDHRTYVVFNVTKDMHIKKVLMAINRCVYEKLACENFQEWKFYGNNLRSTLYMKNQMWTPLFANFNPDLGIPLIRKGIYANDDFKFDAKAAVIFYPEAANYYYKIIGTLFDNDNRKSAIIYLDAYIHVSEKRVVKRKFRNSTRRSSTKKKD